MTDTMNADAGTALAALAPDEHLTDSARRMRDEVLDFVPEMQKLGLEAEQRRALTDTVSVRLKEIGVWDLGAPLEYGGSASGARDLAAILEAVSRGDGSAGWLAQAGATNGTLVLAYPKSAVDEVYADAAAVNGPLLTGASVFARQVGAATKVDGGWKVSGKWGFGTGCRTATWNMVGVDYHKEDGSPSRGLALVPMSKLRILEDWNVTGMSATGSNTLVADEEIFVREDQFFDLREMPARMNALGERWSGPEFGFGAEARMVALTMNLAAVSLGMGQGALESFLGSAPKRTPFNLPYPTIADSAAIQVVVGRSQAALDVARAVIERIANGIDELAAQGQDFTPVEATRTHMELVYAIKLVREAIADLEEALGTSVAVLSNPIQRAHRDLRVLASHGAIRFDPLAEITGRDALGKSFDMTGGGLPSLS